MSGRTITFVLPTSGRLPSGGHRVVYQHANFLAARGHRVMIVHLSDPAPDPRPLPQRARRLIRFAADRYWRDFRPTGWFPLDPRVRCLFWPNQQGRSLPASDILVATSWETAGLVNRHPDPAARKFYFLQSYETWSGSEARVDETWRYPMTRIVISAWLEEIAEGLGVETVFVPNGVDLELFRRSTPAADRPDNAVLFQSMTRELKGSRDAVAALNMLAERGVALDLRAFGDVDPRELGLTVPCRFTKHPPQAHLVGLYDAAAIYVTVSHLEGWGMTMTEAAACGAALVVSDIGGHRSFANDTNAVLVPPRAPAALADALAGLIGDKARRVVLADEAFRSAQAFGWPAASARFEQVLLS